MTGLGTLRVSEAPSAGPWGNNYFHNNAMTLFEFFTLILPRVCGGFSVVYMIMSLFWWICNAYFYALKLCVLIFTTVSIDTFNPHKQKFLESSVLKSLKGFWDLKSLRIATLEENLFTGISGCHKTLFTSAVFILVKYSGEVWQLHACWQQNG